MLPGGILLIWIAMLRQWRGLAALLWPPAIVAFLVVCLPWFWVMQEDYSGFFNYFFVYQQFDRFADAGFNNREPIWFYLPVLAGLVLPWTFWLGAVFRKAFWAERDGDSLCGTAADGHLDRGRAGASFRCRPPSWWDTVLPTLAPLAVLAAEVIVAGLSRSRGEESTRRSYRACLAAAVVLCVLMTVFVAIYARPNAAPLGAAALPQAKPGDQIVMLHAYRVRLAHGDAQCQPGLGGG